MRKELTYVLSLEAKEIYLNEVAQEEMIKHYDVTLAYDLDLMYLDTLGTDVIYNKTIRNKEKQFTDAIINIKFNKVIKEKVGVYDKGKNIGKDRYKTITSTNEFRKMFYENGFDLNNKHYVLYKRSASKAKSGTVLFIDKEYYEQMKQWSLMDINFEQDKEVDLASLLAYQSLSMSGLVDTINIKSSQIVIIEEEFSTFKTMASVTDMIDDEVVVTDREIEQSNNIWDGQALIDKAILPKQYKETGSIQLRNKFFKCMAFNTNIYKFLHNHNVETVKDMFGREYDIKDVKLVITKSCLKALKFSYKVGTDEEMYNHWLNNISSTFGICKEEHETKHGYTEYGTPINRLSYQMINSMPLTKSEIEDLVDYEVNYINSLKNDINAFLKHIELNDNSIAREMVTKLIKHNKYYAQTDVFKKFKKNTINAYIDKVRQGKVRISQADYCILVSNPLEMLYKVAGKYDKAKHPLIGHETYTKLFEDNKPMAIFRSPHICQANILYSINKHCKEIDTYFNFTKNIIVINSIRSLVTQTLSGSDADGDSCLVTTNNVVVDKAHQSKDMLVPINNISFEVTKRPYNNVSAYSIDKEICRNKIGYICNLAQDVNTTIAHLREQQKLIQKMEQDLLNAVSKLSSLSQLEIDRSKKYFAKDELNIDAELEKIKNELPIIEGYFTKYTKSSKKELQYTECPMDMLEKALDEGIEATPKSESFMVLDLIDYKFYNKNSVNEKQIAQIKDLCQRLQTKINSINAERDIEDKDKNKRCYIAKEYAFNDIKKVKYNSSTVIALIGRMYNDENTCSNFKFLLLQALWTNKKGNLYTVMYKLP